MRRWAVFACLLLAACGREAAQAPPAAAAPHPLLHLGLVPEQGLFRQLERYEPLADWVGRHTGTKVTLQVVAHYGGLIEDIEAGKLDGGFFGSFTYVLAHEVLGVVPLARPERPDGNSRYAGVIVVRHGSHLRSLADLRGRRFAFVDRATSAGYLVPLDWFARGGVTDYTAYFAETYFAGSHEAVLADVLAGRADAGAVKDGALHRFAAENPQAGPAFDVLLREGAFPENALVVSRRFDPALAARLRDALLAMSGDPEGRAVLERFGARRFVPTEHADYEEVYRLAGRVHLDLARYAARGR